MVSCYMWGVIVIRNLWGFQEEPSFYVISVVEKQEFEVYVHVHLYCCYLPRMEETSNHQHGFVDINSIFFINLSY